MRFLRSQSSEHRVLICRDGRHLLQNVPVLDDPAIVIEPEDIDASPLAVAWPVLIAVQHNECAVREHPSKLDALAGIFLGHPGEVVNEGILAISHHRVVLRVGGTDESLDCLRWLGPVEHQVVEVGDLTFVALGVVLTANLHFDRVASAWPVQWTKPSELTPFIMTPMLSILTMRAPTTLNTSDTYICDGVGAWR